MTSLVVDLVGALGGGRQRTPPKCLLCDNVHCSDNPNCSCEMVIQHPWEKFSVQLRFFSHPSALHCSQEVYVMRKFSPFLHLLLPFFATPLAGSISIFLPHNLPLISVLTIVLVYIPNLLLPNDETIIAVLSLSPL